MSTSADSTNDESEDDSPTGVLDYFGDSSAGVLSTFASSPAGFIFGVILTPILNGFESIVLTGLDLVNLVFFGDNRGSTDGMIGIADIPVMVTDLFIGLGNTIGWPILNSLRAVSRGAVDIASQAGPLGLLGAAIILVTVVYVFSATIRTLVEIALDFIPGGGALIN